VSLRILHTECFAALTLPAIWVFTPFLTLLLLCGATRQEALLYGAEQRDAVLAQFEARYRSATSLSATFLQKYSENGKLTRMESGKSYFLHPGKMRWDYEAPEKNTFLADGKYVWFITPVDHTATRMPAKQSEDWRTPLALLSDGIRLSRICGKVERSTDLSPAQAGDLVYRCELRGDGKLADSARAETVLFELSMQGELRRIQMEEVAGVQVEFTFKDWQWNPILPKSLFQFEAQPGMVIVNGPLPDSPGVRQ